MERVKPDQPPSSSTDDADRAAIDRLTATFFAAFANERGRSPQLDRLRELFVDGAIIARRAGDEVEMMSVDSFIAPRRALLSSGELTEFSEWETESRTVVMDGIACRWSTYEKKGLMRGEPYGGAGRKILSLVRTADGWKIVSIVWEDER
jgi:hypothetical protein